MRKDLVDNLHIKIDELKNIISHLDTLDILGMIANDLLHSGESLFEKTGLSSPARQYLYLYGLVVSTKQINDGQLNKETWNKIKKLLEDIVWQYSLMFFPTEEEFKKGLSEEWKNTREVCMPVFVEYFNTFLLCYEEQILERINRWFLPFDSLIKGITYCSLNELIRIYQFINEYIDNYFKELSKLAKVEKKIRLEFLEECQKNKLTLKEMREKAQSHPVKETSLEYFKKVQDIYYVKIEDLVDRFGLNLIENFLKIFSVNREERNYRYYTEENPVSKSPLFKENDTKLFSVHPRFLLNAIYEVLNEVIEQSEAREKFYKRRNIESESKTLDIFKSLFTDQGRYFTNIYEIPDGTFEHDILILYKNNVFIIEVKASKVREPLRNPERAFPRIRDDFKRDNGIQKAYDQALQLKKTLLENDITPLYNKKGEKIVEIHRDDIKDIFIICVTAEPFGTIASNLSLLLEKSREENYPWCCNLFDLETFISGLNYKKFTPENFIYYLNKRSELHEKFHAGDELDIAGHFLIYRSFKDIEEKEFDKVSFDPFYSEIFDKIYYEKKGIKYEMKIDDKPAIVNIKEELSELLAQDTTDNENTKGS